MIELKNISVSFQNQTESMGENKSVLNNLSLTLPDEGCVVFRGPSGCGKTTLLRVLAGLIQPDAGELTGLAHRKISMVFQQDRLLPWYSAKDNIALVSDDTTALRMLDAVGLSAEADALPSTLSGGMCRRIAIARALAYANDVLFLDEPFNGLDPELRKSMAELIKKNSRLIVLVTHEDGDAALLGQTQLYQFKENGIIRTI